MLRKSLAIFIVFVLITILANFALAKCPSADLNGDCFVDYEDFALMANQWLTGDPNIPDDMAYIPGSGFEMGDHFSESAFYERPVHAVLLDSFFMSTYKLTNQQYCDYLNSAVDGSEIKIDGDIVYACSDDSNSYPYCDTHGANTESQIDFNEPNFSVRSKGASNRDMSNDPMVAVSWYGAAAYCNWRSSEEGKESCYNLSTWECDFSKSGYRLPTEAEWEYAARGGLSGQRFPWGDTITLRQANYYADPCSAPYDLSLISGSHPLWDDGIYPYTSPVGFFDGTMKYKDDYNWAGSDTSYQTTSGANDYGLYDMAGNVWDWCNDWYDMNYYDVSPFDNPQGPASGISRVLRGGSWTFLAGGSRVAKRSGQIPHDRYSDNGFRVVLDLE